MLIEFYALFSVISIILFIIAFFNYGNINNELLFGICILLFGFLAVSSPNVQSLEPFYNATGNYYYIASYQHIDYSFIGVQILFFALSLLFIFIEIFDKYGKYGTEKGFLKEK